MHDDRSHDAASAPLQPGEYHAIGRFQPLRRIGHGGGGEVWEAWDPRVERCVALKLLAAGAAGDAALVERFLREARACAKVEHDSVVAIYEVGEHGGRPFFVQELVSGGHTLAELIEEWRGTDQRPPEHFERIARLFAALADALEAVHACGVIHRDVKPANILVTERDSPKLIDFGIAALADSATLSGEGERVGTPNYMSPEQFTGTRERLSPASDVFALGVTLYEALTLARPFQADSPELVRHRVLHEEPLDPRRIEPRVPRDLAVICAKAIEKLARQRFASMRELRDELQRFLAHEPIRAKPLGPLGRARKWARRHRVASSTGAVALGALVVISLLFVRERRAWARERDAASTADAALEFLVKTIVDIDPERSRGRPLASREALARLAAQLDSRFPERGLVRARLLHALGSVAVTLSDLTLAHKLLDEALEIRRALLGPSDPATIETMVTLGGVLISQSELPPARELLTQARALLLALKAPDPVALARVEHNLGVERFHSGDLTAAEALLRSALERRLGQPGGESVETLKSESNLAAVFGRQGKTEQAREMFASALERALRIDEDSPTTLSLMSNVAAAGVQLGDPARAEVLLRRVLERQSVVLPADHLSRATTLSVLSAACEAQGRFDEAIEHARAALAIRRGQLSPDDPSLARLYNALGYTHLRMGALEEAERWLDQARAALLGRVAASDEDLLSATSNLADVYQRTGRAAQGEPLARAVLEVRGSLPAAHPHRLMSETVLARCLADLGRVDEARELLQRVVEATTDARELEERSQLLSELERRAAAASTR